MKIEAQKRLRDIADCCAAAEVAELIRKLGYEPVWKDWDAALTA
jgi:2-iminoacetate synthase ThiH